ncbi:MAG: deoxyribonuclease IV [Planctomycetota bacterium]
MLLGSHLSIAGSMTNALDEAAALRLDTVQVFTKNQRQWKVKPLEETARDAWLGLMDALGWRGRVVAHDAYLINLASPDDAMWNKSIALMREEIERCAALAIPYLVSHPGAHMLKDNAYEHGVEPGLVRIAKAYKKLFKDTTGYKVTMCLENTAGGGTTLGRTFEELARLRELILQEAGAHADLPGQNEPGGRVGFCLDTCHALAAGYDIASHASGDGTGKKRTRAEAENLGSAWLDEADATIGLHRIGAFHLNDSKGARGSHIDRHEHIGKGNVALGAFAAIVNRSELAGTPMILETPKGENDKGVAWDTVNSRALKRLVKKN